MRSLIWLFRYGKRIRQLNAEYSVLKQEFDWQLRLARATNETASYYSKNGRYAMFWEMQRRFDARMRYVDSILASMIRNTDEIGRLTHA